MKMTIKISSQSKSDLHLYKMLGLTLADKIDKRIHDGVAGGVIVFPPENNVIVTVYWEGPRPDRFVEFLSKALSSWKLEPIRPKKKGTIFFCKEKYNFDSGRWNWFT